MRRTQLYLEDDLWKLLHALARERRTTISDLVRQAVRDRYVGNFEQRRKAMLNIVGMRAKRSDIADTEAYIRDLRRGSRLERLNGE